MMLPNNAAWMADGLCTQVDPGELFFPSKGDGFAAPKRVCRSCDVAPECLAYALEHDIRDGIWGGTSENERKRMRRAG